MTFNAYEAFEMAGQIERNGLEFYTKAAAKVSDPSARKLLQSLAEMERQHEKYFATLKEDYKLLPQSELPDLDDQYVQYVDSQVKGKVFNDSAAAKIKEGCSVEEAIEMALAFERSTVVYFATIKESVPRKLGKDRIDEIIKEEVRHIAILNGHLEFLKDKAKG